MPLTPQEKNAQSYNAIKNGLFNLNKFISANGSDNLFALFTENKKKEIDDLLFIPARQPNSNTILKSGAATDFLKITGDWFIPSNKGDPKNEIRENVFKLFSFDEKKTRELRQELTKNKQPTEQVIINQLETFEAKIGNLTTEQTFIYINLSFFVRWDNIVSLFRLQEIQKSLNAKKFIPLSPENYELLKNKPEPTQALSFSQLGHIKDWSKVKNGILNDLVPPQTDSLSSDSIPSSSNTEINPSASANYNANPVENSSASTDTSVSITPSIDTQIVINESAQNQEIAQLKHTKKELEEKSQSLEATKTKLETQISELQNLLQNKEDVLHRESESNKQKLENLQTTLAFFQKNTKDKEVELESLKKLKEDYLLSLQGAKSDLQKTKKEKNDLTTKLNETEVKIKTLEVNNTKLAAEIDKTNTKLIEMANALELKSSDHIAALKQLSDLQTQHANLQASLETQTKLLQGDLESKEVNSQLVYIEISKLNDEISFTKNKLNSANQKYDESKETIVNLKLNKSELEEEKNELITQKNEIQDQLSKQKDTHQALVKNHALLMADSIKKDQALEKQKNVITKVEGQLKDQTEQSDQLKEEIKGKDKQIEEQRQKITKIIETLQEKEKEFQQITGQLDAIKLQLHEANEGEKTAFEKLAANELKMQEFGSLKEQISQTKESYNELNIKLHSEENKTANLVQELNTLNEEVSAFIQTVQSELDKLNPQTHQEHDSIEAKYQIKPIYTTVPLDQDATGISTVISIVPYDQTFEQLDHSKRQLFSTLYNLKAQDEQKKRLLEIKERENDALRNQYKDLEKTSNTLINASTKKLTAEKALLEERVTSLTNQLIQLEEQNKELYQATTPANYSLEDNWDSDNEETADDNELTAYQEELVWIRASLKETKTELEKKNNELTRLQEKLFTQTEESNLNKTELAKEIDALKKSSEEAAQTISALNDEKEKLNKDLINAQEISQKSKFETTNLQGELDKLQKNDSSNQEAISKLTNQIQDLKELDLQKEESIRELTQKIEINASLIEYKENQIKDLSKTLVETQEKSEQLENRNHQLEQQTIKDQQHIDQLTNGTIAFSSQIKELTDEKENLSQALNIAHEKQKNLEAEKNSLQDEIERLQTNKSTDIEQISDLTNRLDELNKLKSQQEKLISELQSQLTKNTELQELFDRHSVNDELITDLRNTIYIYKNKLIETEKEIETLKEKLATRQKDDGNLREDYAKLDRKLSEKNSELNEIKIEFDNAKKQLEEAQAKNITQGEMGMPNTGENLIDFGNSIGEDHLDQIHPTTNLINKNGSSSGHSSRHSSSNSHASSENIPGFFDSGLTFGQRRMSQDDAFGKGDSLNGSDPVRSDSALSLSNDEVEEEPKVHRIDPIDTGTPMPTQEQQSAQVDNTSSIHARGVINAFNEEHHEEISRAFRAEFSRIATHAAKNLFNDDIDSSELPNFENKLQEISTSEITTLISELSNRPELLTRTIEKIHTNGINYLTYLEEVKNSASFIFGTLQVGQKNYKDYIADIGKDLLINCCIENLQTNEKDKLLEDAKTMLADKASDNDLQPHEHTEKIKTAAEQLVKKLLKADKLKSIIEDAKIVPIDGVNRLEASKQKLQEQLEQGVDQTFDHYFPIVHLNPIFRKIKDGEVLSEEEIQKIPLELQYSDTREDFALGLAANYPHLKSFPISKDVFDKSVLILRKNALSTINQTLINNDELVDLSAEAWLEKKLALVTDKSIALKLDKKQQKDLDNKFYKLFPLSPLEAMAVTHKSVDELTNELEKLHDLKIKAAARLYKTFSEIEIKLKEYPNLIDEKDAEIFKANLNNSLPLIFSIRDVNGRPNVNDAQIKIILKKINYRLENDSSKWNWLNNKLTEEITNDILADDANQFGAANKEAIQMLVSNTLEILRKFHDLQDTLNKREKWKTDIKSLYAFTEKLRPNSQFSEEIEKREDILEDMLVLKQVDAEERTVVMPKGVYIPNKCRIIPNFQSDPSDTYQFDVQASVFHKQKALASDETVTFAQKLENEKICKWSVTRSADKCLAYKTEKKFFRREKSYMQEISFAQMIHAVNSFKNAKTCTLNFGNCSDAIKEKLYLFAHAYNELRRDNGPQKGPRIMCHMKNPPDMDKDKIAKAKEEIKTKLNLHTEELADTSEKLKDDTISHKTIRSRG